MDVKRVVVETAGDLNPREAANILRSVGTIFLPGHVAGDPFPYDIGSHFGEGEGCITYKPLTGGGMEMRFTPFYTKQRILTLEERTNRLELFCVTLRDGFGQLANVVSQEILQDAARALGPVKR